MALAPFARKLDGGLVGLGAAVAEEDAIERRVLGQQLRQLQLRDRIEEVGDVDQLRGLLGERSLYARAGGAEREDGDHGDQGDVTVAHVMPLQGSLIEP